MKKLLCVLLLLSMAVLASCSSPEQVESDLKYSVGIIVSDKSDGCLDMEAGLLEGLRELGIDRDNSNIVCKYAGYEGYPLEDICLSMATGGYDAVVCIGEAAAKAYVLQDPRTPCFVCGVATIYEIGITDPEGHLVTGVLSSFHAEETVSVVNALTPNVEKFGLLYCADGALSESTVNGFCQYLDMVHINYTLSSVGEGSVAADVARELIGGGAEAIFVSNGVTEYGAMAEIVDACCLQGIPVYCSETAGVREGALAAVIGSDSKMGRQTAELVSEYLKGEPLESLPFVCGNADLCAFNEATAARLGAEYPAELPYKAVKYS